MTDPTSPQPEPTSGPQPDAEQLASEAGKQQRPSDPALPRFLTQPQRRDKVLLGLLALMTMYSMLLIPLRPQLLVNAPWALTLLSGSGLGLLITAAQNQGATLLLAFLSLAAAGSHIKFMLVYFLMGKYWGQDFINWMFASHTPLWWRKLEGFIERNLLLSLLLGFIPFSPIPATILVALAGIRKMKGWLLGVYIYLLALANKLFYLYLGLRFGEGIQPTLETIDRYMMQITLALIAYVFVVNWWKNSRKKTH